jgi:hypothetical protein
MTVSNYNIEFYIGRNEATMLLFSMIGELIDIGNMQEGKIKNVLEGHTCLCR